MPIYLLTLSHTQPGMPVASIFITLQPGNGPAACSPSLQAILHVGVKLCPQSCLPPLQASYDDVVRQYMSEEEHAEIVHTCEMSSKLWKHRLRKLFLLGMDSGMRAVGNHREPQL